MGGLVKEVLRRLCVEFGWSYAVFWKLIGFGDQMNLVWEDGHCERTSVASAASGFEAIDLLIKESGVLRCSQNGGFSQLGGTEDRVRTLVFKLMATQVHLVGDGIVGKAALTGKHEWMLGDMLSNRSSTSKVLAEINNQLLAGIKTTAIIPVLPQGILQLGSTQMLPENYGFIVHAKSLFGQLQFVRGAVLSSDTQKILCQKLVESTGMQMTHKQYREARTDINGASSVNDDNHNHQHFSPALSRTFTEICPSSTQLYDQMSAIVSETSLAKENMSSKMVPPSTQPIVETHHKQVESGAQEAHIMFSNPDARLLQSILPCKSDSQNHEQSPTGLPYNRLAFLEEQVLSMPSVRAGEFANNRESTLANTNMLQLLSYGCTSLHPLQGSESISSFPRSQLLESANGIGKFNSFASGIGSFRSQHAESSGTELPQVLNPIDHLEQGHLNSIDTIFHSGSPREKQKSNNGQYQASEGQFTQYDEHGSSYSPLLDPVQKNKAHLESPCVENGRDPTPAGSGNKSNEKAGNLQALDEKISVSLLQSSSANDLFDALRLDQCKSGLSDSKLDNVKIHAAENAHGLNTDVSNCITEFEEYLGYNALNNELFCCGMFSEAGSDQLLDAVVSQFNPGARYEMDDIASCKNPLTKISSSSTNGCATTCKKTHAETFSLPPVPIKPEPAPSSSLKSSCSIERSDGCISQSHGSYKSQINLWIEGQKMSNDNHSGAHGKKVDEGGKQVRKRSRPGENPRPRPKDRQMIQDRVKELREIIPNGPKLSIDALLEKTIKHMLFLQSVTKHADKLKEIGEPKILSKDGGLLLKDNFEGGATWAFEVGSQSMTCPIIVEDLNPPRQMLVEMLCEERGLFLEIADLVRGLGLTILKGAMETRGDKIWARFAVEANRDVTRMEIFLSLVQLLQPSAISNEIPEGLNTPQNMFHSPSIPATGLSDRLW